MLQYLLRTKTWSSSNFLVLPAIAQSIRVQGVCGTAVYPIQLGEFPVTITITMDPETSSTARADGRTRVLSVDCSKIGSFCFEDSQQSFLGNWTVKLLDDSEDAAYLREAATHIRSSDTPVAFPTETVYGLGADATRSSAVRGIYVAKQRPADNPLIVHVCSLGQLRHLLKSEHVRSSATDPMDCSNDPIPPIYHCLISKFWPGPLTIILPLPTPSPFAPEVTTTMPSFGVRMPSSRLALALINVAGVPLAAPSANSSTKPSPTTASHVLHDLNGRIDLILDGGPCNIGVESTVVDGMVRPPVVLRPGGISIDKLKKCPGWEDVRVGYGDVLETGTPRAPGMKYKHYSPKARLILVHGELDVAPLKSYVGRAQTVGLLRTETRVKQPKPQSTWADDEEDVTQGACASGAMNHINSERENTSAFIAPEQQSHPVLLDVTGRQRIDVWTVKLGPTSADVAQGLFSALRELDQKDVDLIFVQGIKDDGGDVAAAVMNRLRKAADCEIQV